MKGHLLLLLLPLGASALGCIIIPIPRSTKQEGVRPKIPWEQLVAIEPGVTSRRRSLLILGEPDQALRIGPETYDCYLTRATLTDVMVGLPIPNVRGITLRNGSREYLFIHSGKDGIVKKHAFRNLVLNVEDRGVGESSVREMIEDWEAELPDVLATPRKR